MSENEKKELKEDKNKKNDQNPFNGLWGWFIACFVLSFFMNWFFLGGSFDTSVSNTIVNEAFVQNLKETSYGTLQKETVFRCTTFSPIFTEDGTKQYDVRFKDINSDLYFSVVLPAQEVDTLKNIEKDARYEGTISYLYADKAFTEPTKELEEGKVEERILALLEGKSEYAKFGTVSDISFMYSNYIEDINVEKATEYLDGYIDKLVNPPVEETAKKVPFAGFTSK